MGTVAILHFAKLQATRLNGWKDASRGSRMLTHGGQDDEKDRAIWVSLEGLQVGVPILLGRG